MATHSEDKLHSDCILLTIGEARREILKSLEISLKRGGETLKKADKSREKNAKTAISYHMKCTKTANGLTHFVMYGDIPKKKMPL